MSSQETVSNNKIIAKNTVFLYFRTAITIVISLFTSRIILRELGVSDYGVYSVVGGFVALSSALTATLSGSTQRYITYAIGENVPGKIKHVFSSCVFIHILIAIVCLLLLESIGVWFISNKLNIPSDREFEALFIFQTSIIIFIVKVITSPYSAAIIAYEKFGFFSINSIVEAVVRLMLVYSIRFWDADVLITYAIIELIVRVVSNSSFVLFCFNCFKECRLKFTYDGSLYKDLISFSGWNFLGTCSSIAYSQGSGVVLNMFFSVIQNAAMGITNQISGVITTFVSNFTVAINPQITKSYASSDYERVSYLLFLGTRISSCLLLLAGLPLIANLDFILHLWLIDVPPNANIYILLSLISIFCSSFTVPFNTLIFATGDIKLYQIVCVIINVGAILLLYTLFCLNFKSYTIYSIMILQSIFKLVYMIRFAKNRIFFPLLLYMKQVIFRILFICAIIVVVLFVKLCYLTYEISFPIFLLESFLYISLTSVLILVFIISERERRIVKNFIYSKFRKNDR